MTDQSLSDTTADLIDRSTVMWLIEREIQNWLDTDPPRHALSVLWGKVRDMTDADTVERERMDREQHQSTVSARRIETHHPRPPVLAWQPMSTAPPDFEQQRANDILLLVKYGPTEHAETGCRAEWSSTGWVCTNSQAGGMEECEPLGWWPIPPTKDDRDGG